jgi:hypothetical protein
MALYDFIMELSVEKLIYYDTAQNTLQIIFSFNTNFLRFHSYCLTN